MLKQRVNILMGKGIQRISFFEGYRHNLNSVIIEEPKMNFKTFCNTRYKDVHTVM